MPNQRVTADSFSAFKTPDVFNNHEAFDQSRAANRAKGERSVGISYAVKEATIVFLRAEAPRTPAACCRTSTLLFQEAGILTLDRQPASDSSPTKQLAEAALELALNKSKTTRSEEMPVIGYYAFSQTVVVTEGETLTGARVGIAPPSFFGTVGRRTQAELDSSDGHTNYKNCAITAGGRVFLGPGDRVLDKDKGREIYRQEFVL